MYREATKGRLFKHFAFNAAIYGASLGLVRFGWVLLLPLYWQKLSPADYGVIGIAQLVQVVLGPILSIGLHDAIQRFFHEWNDDERPRYVAALWTVSLVFSIVICALLNWAGPWLFEQLFNQVPFDPYLQITLWAAFFTNLSVFPLAILRSRERLKTFSAITILAFLSQATLTLYFVLGLDMGAHGYLLGVLLSAILMGGCYVFLMLRECHFKFSMQHISRPLRYSLPTVPVAILDGTASLFDRFFLDKHVPLAQIGLYNLSNQFGSAFNFFNQTLKTSWLPFLYRVVSEREDGPEVLSRYAVYYLALLVVPALAISLLSEELIELIGNSQYYGVYTYVPGFVLIYYIQSVAAAMGRGMDLAKKTHLWPAVPISSIVVSLLGLSILVPSHGLWGAIAALVVAAIVRVTVQVWLSVRYYPRPLRLGQLSVIWLIGVLFFGMGFALDGIPWWVEVLAKLGLIVVAIVIIGRLVIGRAGFANILGLLRNSLRIKGE